MRRHLILASIGLLATSAAASARPPGFAGKWASRPGDFSRNPKDEPNPNPNPNNPPAFELPKTEEEFKAAVAEAAKVAAAAAATEAVEAYKKTQTDASEQAKRDAEAARLAAEGKWQELNKQQEQEIQRLKDQAAVATLNATKATIIAEFGLNGVNAALAESLTGTDEATLRASAARLAEFKKEAPKTPPANSQGAGGGAENPTGSAANQQQNQRTAPTDKADPVKLVAGVTQRFWNPTAPASRAA